MLKSECKLLFAGYPKLNLLFGSGVQDVLAIYEYLGYTIGPLLTLYKLLIDEHEDKK